MPNVRPFVEAAHQAYGAEMTEPPKRHGPRPLGLGRVLFSHGFRVKDAADEVLTRRSNTRFGGSDRSATSKKRSPVNTIAVETLERAYVGVRLGRIAGY
jgi:hypothetical protein